METRPGTPSVPPQRTGTDWEVNPYSSHRVETEETVDPVIRLRSDGIPQGLQCPLPKREGVSDRTRKQTPEGQADVRGLCRA